MSRAGGTALHNSAGFLSSTLGSQPDTTAPTFGNSSSPDSLRITPQLFTPFVSYLHLILQHPCSFLSFTLSNRERRIRRHSDVCEQLVNMRSITLVHWAVTRSTFTSQRNAFQFTSFATLQLRPSPSAGSLSGERGQPRLINRAEVWYEHWSTSTAQVRSRLAAPLATSRDSTG